MLDGGSPSLSIDVMGFCVKSTDEREDEEKSGFGIPDDSLICQKCQVSVYGNVRLVGFVKF